jgi:hypothetical protein
VDHHFFVYAEDEQQEKQGEENEFTHYLPKKRKRTCETAYKDMLDYALKFIIHFCEMFITWE